MATETLEVEGHIIDSLILAKLLDLIVASGADYEIVDIDVGKANADLSTARVRVTATDEDSLTALLEELQAHGANRVSAADASLAAAESDGVLPAGFYSTTNLPTSIRVDGHWLEVASPEMDCAVTYSSEGARTLPMHRVRAGDQIVVGSEGIRVTALEKPRGSHPFEFMASEVSSEKPKARLLAEVAERIRRARDREAKVLVVAGPALIHTGAGPDLAALVKGGWVHALFAGNGFATHDIESNVLGTSLGVSLTEGAGVEGGHSNHLRVINEIRRFGSIAAAVEAGYVRSGVMYELVSAGLPFVLGGSVRDDGPLPDVHTDVVAAADAMREIVPGVGVALMLASTLHAIGTGNLLPAGVETFCVDINQAVVTKLADRGSHQALGIVTDVGLFVQGLREQLCG